MSIKGLYIQIPFSNHVCGDVLEFSNTSFYIDKLIEDLKDKQKYYQSIYIGGGNLLKLSKDNLQNLMDHLPEYDHLTLEVNPYYLDNLEVLKDKRKIRLCLGVQKEDDHNYYHFKDAIHTLRTHGFNNISLEIPYALASQTLTQYREVLKSLIHLRPDHISIYPESDDSEDYYDMTKWMLESHGYDHYEVTSFCIHNKKSPQTLIYSQYEDFDALGMDAFLKIGNKRQRWNDNFELETVEVMDETEALFEKVFMFLHLKEGISIKETEGKIDWNIPGIEVKDDHARLKSFKYLFSVMEDISKQLNG